MKIKLTSTRPVSSDPNLPKVQPQYLATNAKKINLKLGGINQLVHSPRLGTINEGKMMIVGIDVTHPSPSPASSAPSVAGMVASVNRWPGQWPRVTKEIVSELESMLNPRLHL